MDIRAYIREEIARDDTPRTPREISDRILGRLDEQQLAEAATAAFPALVREILNSTRPAAQRAAQHLAAGQRDDEAHTSDVGGTFFPAATADPKPNAGSPQGRNVTPIKGKSWKRDGIRANWRKELDARYPDAAGRHKRLADFSADELDALAARCREQAAANAHAATRWESLARLTRTAGVDRLADVDDAALANAMGGAA